MTAIIAPATAGNQPPTSPSAPPLAGDPARSVYRERAHLLALLTRVFWAHWADPDPADPHRDRPLLCVHTATGPLTWHVDPADQELFDPQMPTGASHFDGHTRAEKLARVDRLVRHTHTATATCDTCDWTAPFPNALAAAAAVHRCADIPLPESVAPEPESVVAMPTSAPHAVPVRRPRVALAGGTATGYRTAGELA